MRGYCKKAAFTLAEVLITLLIIGVVAALALPTLMQNISDRKNSTKVAVFNSKFIQGLNLTKNAGEMGTQYSSTYDFLKNGLSNHLKMAAICDSSHLKDCLGYDEIKYEMKSGKEKTVKVSSLKTADSINIKDAGFEDTAAFIMGDGTPVLLSYNLNCMDDGGVDKTISPCVAGLFDLNGKSQPNMFLNKIVKGKSEARDIRSFNGASVNGCIGFINDLCIAGAARYTDDNLYALVKNSLGNSYTRPTYKGYGCDCTVAEVPCSICRSGIINNNWQLGVDYCEKAVGGHMASLSELKQISTELYDFNKSGTTMKNKDAAFSVLGLTDNPTEFLLWASDPNNGQMAYFRYFSSSRTFESNHYRLYNVEPRAVCLD